VVRVHDTYYDQTLLLIQSQVNDMASRKDAVMQNIRQELALANAQELMNVGAFNTQLSSAVH